MLQIMSVLWTVFTLAVLCVRSVRPDGHTRRPLNIGHRGACGIYPEHTVAAYMQAVEDGADMIECDITITKDLHLVCRHENWLQHSTDVQYHPEFKDRLTTHLVDGANITDWFAADFTLEELRQLRAVQVLSFRDQSFNDRYPVATLEEFITVAREADRKVDIYPEIKDAAFINSLGILPEGTRFEAIVISELQKHGYSSKEDGCILQSFEEDSLNYIAKDLKSELPLTVMHWIDVDETTLDRWANMGLVAVGFWKDQVFQHYKNGSYKHNIWKTTDLIEKIHARGMQAHVFTFRNEDEYLPWDDAQDPYQEFERFLKKGPDAYFVDFPATFKRFLDNVYTPDIKVNSAEALRMSFWCVVSTTLALTLRSHF